MLNLHTLEIKHDGKTVARICFKGDIEDAPNWCLDPNYTVTYYDPYFCSPLKWYKWETVKQYIDGVYMGGSVSQYVQCSAKEAAKLSGNGGKILLSV